MTTDVVIRAHVPDRAAEDDGRSPTSVLAALASRRRGSSPRGTRRMRVLCTALGSPQLVLPTIHVVGTDGKTSVVRIVAALLEALGIRTGETTSPHLQDVRERIRIGGRPIVDAALARATARLEEALAAVDREAGEPATFFEAVTATALRAFADAAVDVAVVEAGIGGARDATGVVQGRVAVVTPVSSDHPELGADLAQVATEKGGVVGPGTTLVSAAQPPEVADALARVAAGRGAVLLRAGHDFGVLTRRPVAGGQHVGLRGLSGSRLRATLPLRGAHQAANAATALAAVQAFLGTTELDPALLRAGFAAVEVPGRVEVIRRADVADVVLDGAHDAAAVRALVAAVRESPPLGGCAVVLGVGGGRDATEMVQALHELTPTFVVTSARSPTAMPTQPLAACVRAAGAEAVAVPDVGDAVHEASRQVPPDGLVVVTGSLHLVGDARTALGGRPS